MPFSRPRYIQLYPTTRCNQGCSFCFNTSSEQVSDMTYEAALRLLEILSWHGIDDLDIMGGEPFLLEWMTDFTCSRHFGLALKSIQTLVSLGLDPIVKTVLNRTTLRDIENIVTLIGDLGVRRYYLIHMDVMAKDPSLLNESMSYTDFVAHCEKIGKASPHVGVFRVNASCFAKENLPPGARCAGGVLKLSVMPDGSAYPCNLFHQNREFHLGNIFEEGITAIWRHTRLSFFRTFSGNKCGLDDCRNRDACTGGCPAHGYLHYSDPDASDIRCGAPLVDFAF
jgi:radical SAM protein with 4Fe4S-binding SPASM domain